MAKRGEVQLAATHAEGGSVTHSLSHNLAFECIRSQDAVRAQRTADSIVVRRLKLADVEQEAISWLWRGYVPFGKLTVLEGDPGLSKSTLTLWLAARLSRGLVLPDGSTPDAADSLFITYEDGVADTLRPRAELAGADLERIHVLAGLSANGDDERPFVIPNDVSLIRQHIEETRARLLVIDPLDAALSGASDSYKGQDMRRALAPLAIAAEETGAAVVVVRHLTKARSANAITAGAGSIGIAGAARCVLAVHRHPEDEANGSRRLLAVAKCNLAPLAPSREYCLVSHGDHARIEWGGESTLSADTLTATRGDAEEHEARKDAKEFLRALLHNGPRLKSEVVREGEKECISTRTLERAARELGIRPSRAGFGASATWSLPTPACSPDLPSLATFANANNAGETGETAASPDENGVIRDSNGSRLSPLRISSLLAERAARRATFDPRVGQ